ncbi:hypothetical protein FA13DRAFT_1716359 [Coprinellus micaceus]|uniref:Uncharacterized protein n=1 Tax=Coprinellus micaceus TaxID=71717 RepID=A0A4Y7SJS3_COPMI|nr:hypothetical protein FA13DRAFT_1716359 [Coprinellus micaceus]
MDDFRERAGPLTWPESCPKNTLRGNDVEKRDLPQMAAERCEQAGHKVSLPLSDAASPIPCLDASPDSPTTKPHTTLTPAVTPELEERSRRLGSLLLAQAHQPPSSQVAHPSAAPTTTTLGTPPAPSINGASTVQQRDYIYSVTHPTAATPVSISTASPSQTFNADCGGVIASNLPYVVLVLIQSLGASPSEVRVLSYCKWAFRSVGNRSHHRLLAEEYCRSFAPWTGLLDFEPVEHQYSLLNHAPRYHHDLIPGATLLLKHIVELEAQYNAINLPCLYAFCHSLTCGVKRAFMTLLRLDSLHVHAQNSCFVDTPRELWHHAQLKMSPVARQVLLLHFPSGSFMGVTTPESIRTLQRELNLGQSLTKRHVFDVWELYPVGEYGCAASWLQHAIWHGTGANAQALFGTQHVVAARCAEGHTSSIYDPPEPYPTALQRHYGADTTITTQHYIPRNRADSGHSIHTHPTNHPCTHPNCFTPSYIEKVYVVWPRFSTAVPKPSEIPVTTASIHLRLRRPSLQLPKDASHALQPSMSKPTRPRFPELLTPTLYQALVQLDGSLRRVLRDTDATVSNTTSPIRAIDAHGNPINPTCLLTPEQRLGWREGPSTNSRRLRTCIFPLRIDVQSAARTHSSSVELSRPNRELSCKSCVNVNGTLNRFVSRGEFTAGEGDFEWLREERTIRFEPLTGGFFPAGTPSRTAAQLCLSNFMA